jgi:hypothetical protein
VGVLSGKDLFNSKYITAVIIDSSNRSFFVPIKYTLGDYFLTVIDKRLYVFRMNERVLTYRHTLVKSFRWYLYTTDHYLPMSPQRLKELEQILEKNSLPRMNLMLFNILKYLGKREKSQFVPHKIESLVAELVSHQDQYSEQIANLLNYLDHLSVDEIVTPVRKISEFIEDDLLATDPKFFGDVINFFKRTDVELKHVNNAPITGKKNWLLWIAIMLGVALIAVVIIWAWQTGKFDGILPDFSNFKGFQFTPPQSNDIMKQYPDPVDLKIAIDQGKVDYNSLPENIKKLVDTVKLPDAKPAP